VVCCLETDAGIAGLNGVKALRQLDFIVEQFFDLFALHRVFFLRETVAQLNESHLVRDAAVMDGDSFSDAQFSRKRG